MYSAILRIVLYENSYYRRCWVYWSHVVDALIQEGHHVIVIDNLCHGKQEYISLMLTLLIFAIAHCCYFEREQPEVVIHNAAHISVPHSIQDPVHDAHTNILGTLNILEHARGGG